MSAREQIAIKVDVIAIQAQRLTGSLPGGVISPMTVSKVAARRGHATAGRRPSVRRSEPASHMA